MWGVSLWVAAIAATVLMLQPRIYEKSKSLGLFLHFCIAIPFLALSSRFIVNDTSIQYVVAFGGEALPLRYRFAATWAAREGPLLMWALWLTLLAWIWRKPMTKLEDTSSQDLRLRLVHGFSLILILISISLDPFKQTPDFFIGAGLNELLQTDLMVIHPPLIFLGYSFCIHLSAISISKIFNKSKSGVKEQILSVVRPGLLVLTLGIGLGGLWAYLILDWGGYWAWDPVETGSFLPWLALVALSHLRTRPGKASDNAWIGGGLIAGGLALFATLVTRAGGVWASSVHTFVASDDGTAPSDAFSRMILLKSDNAVGVEVITYLLILFLLAGCWLLAIRRKNLTSQNDNNGSQIFLIPLIGAFLAVFVGADLYSFIPDYIFPLSLLSFITVDYLADRGKEIETTGWTYYSHKYVPTIAIVILVSFFLTQQVFFVLLFLLFFTPMYYSKDASKEWIWATFGVMLCLAAAWASLIEVVYAGILLLIFIAPWLLEKYEEQENSFSLFSRKWQQIIALWGSVLVISTYLILTLVILIGSIDAVNFEAHELYGAPFILAFSISMMLYLNRKNDPAKTFNVLSTLVILSILLAVFFPHALGADSDSSISSMIVRGAVAWIYLPILLVCIAPLISEIRTQATVKKSTPLLKRIPLAAHIVHLGLVLLIIGHVSTTLLVDRGDASHRITLIKDEIVIDNGYGYQFNEAIATSENLEVGDGYVGIDITIYEVNDGVVGEKIGDVEPGMLRFDKTGTARSEIDILTRWSGDIVFIFDGTQADSLMKQSQIEGLESIELVRVTVYDLPASHLVWLGWATMMVGMTMITYASSDKKAALKAQGSSISEQE
ncbi:MAG: cytochrome c biogenesis protein CcsA [Candidatus Poseidoniaceae archaeon]|nr:cytochrome c biogenesis protein CcsA [Candidatus Poseidoniaceae archaeon]